MLFRAENLRTLSSLLSKSFSKVLSAIFENLADGHSFINSISVWGGISITNTRGILTGYRESTGL